MKLPDGIFYSTIKKKPVWLLLSVSLIIGPFANASLNILSNLLRLPFFFDSIATAVTAAVFGPLAGIITGFGTNWVIELYSGFPMTHYPFAICGMATGLIVGLAAKRDRFTTIQSFFIVLLLVTVANSVLGSLIATFLFGGITETNLDFLVTGIVVAGRSIFSAAFLARLPANLIDKGIALGAAFVVYNRLFLQRSLFSGPIEPDTDNDTASE